MVNRKNKVQGAFVKFSYRPDIDGLRAIAVSMVLAVHAFPSRLPNGYVGVDVFFVISGFLITSILLRELSEGSYSLRDFYVRRVNRILPGLLLVLMFVLLAGPLVMYSAEYGQMGKSALFSALFSANVHFYLEAGYWDVASKLKPLLHLWSLGVEEQFYVLWPLILWWAHRCRRSPVAVALVVLFLSLATNLALTPRSQPAAFYLPMGRFWELASGGLLACLQWNRQVTGQMAQAAWHQGGVQHVMGWGGIGLLATTQVVPVSADAFPGFYAVVVVLAACLLVLAGPQAWVNQRLLAHPAMVYLGKISYPLYLWHWPLLVFVRLMGDGQWSAGHRNTALVVSVLLAVATHHGVERPLSRIKGRGVLALVLGVLMVGVGGMACLAQWGRMPLAPAPYANAPVSDYDKPEIRSQGLVVLLGDSNAGHMSYGLSLLYGDRLQTHATPGWPYLDGVKYRDGYVPHHDHKGSPNLTQETLLRVEADPQVRLVILSNAYLMYLPADNLRSELPLAAPETVTQAYEAGMRRTLQRLVAHGKKVVLIKSIPTYPMLSTVTACSAEVRPPLRRQPTDCVRSRDAVQAERVDYDALVGRAVAGLPGVDVFDTLEELCDDHACYVARNGTQMYIDSGHYTTAGSQLMGAAVARRVERLLAQP